MSIRPLLSKLSELGRSIEVPDGTGDAATNTQKTICKLFNNVTFVVVMVFI